MMRRHPVGMAVLGLSAALTILGCASTEERQRRALVDGLNAGLGQFKESRIVQIGPPIQCTVVQNEGGEICEWRTDGGQLLYRYDARGIARSWNYTDSQFGRMESAQYSDQGQPGQESVWQSIKETFRGMNYGFATPGSPSGR